MKTVTISWLNLLDGLAKSLLWILLFINVVIDKYEIALVYAIIIIAYSMSDIADAIKGKNNE